MVKVLGVFLIFIFIIMIFEAVFGVLGSIFGAISEFLFNTKWGIISIIFLTLSGFLFYASSKSYTQAQEKGRVIDTVKPLLQKLDNSFNKSKTSEMSKSNESISKVDTDTNVIDLSTVDLQSMARKLAIAINQPNPVFFKGWGNRRLQLDVERVYIIQGYIDAVRQAGESFINLQADAVLSYEKIENLVKINRNVLLRQLRDSELQIDLLEKEHQAKVEKLQIDVAHLESLVLEKIAQVENLNAHTEQILSEIKNKVKEIDTEIQIKKDTAEADIRIREDESKARIQLEKDKAQAEIYIMKLKATDDSDISKKRATALDMVIKEMNMDNITPTEVYLLIKLLDTNNTSDFLDFTNKMKVMEEELEKMKIQNDILKADAKERKAKADEVEAQSKQNIKDLYSNK